MNNEKIKRPMGLTLFAFAWLISGIINIYLAYRIVSADFEGLQYISTPGIPEWFSFAVPIELTLSAFVLGLGFFQILTVPGLLAGKKYSHKLALAIPVAIVIAHLAFLGLYSSAPSEIDLDNSMIYPAVSLVVGMFWLLVYWKYLEKPNLRTYLGITEPRPIVAAKIKFYCEYCGAENKIDAESFEKSDKDIEQSS